LNHKIQKATKSTSTSRKRTQIKTLDKKLEQLKILKEQQKPYDQFEIFALQDDDESDHDDIKLLKKLNHLKFNYGKYMNNSKCLECGDCNLYGHYKNLYECHQCKYNTFCSKSFEYHLYKHLKSTRIALWNRSLIDYHFYECECSFKCNNGNQMAEHHLNCDYKSCRVFV
jgi:predicted Zn-ribbon and HTH transcriptional regulator